MPRRCEEQLSYAIGIPHPISIKVDTFGTGTVSEAELSRIISLIFDLTTKGVIQMLNLKRFIYRQTTYEGQFDRERSDFTWENRLS
ncbi:methionine adenosyltransferase domain-containing protein [Candidatus Protochlamydia sp. W-9]|uniref:methionine adenosyltransferase domain-containing protein n=1 Tax=Candidatus Protochlamydia sp. W-9 TaxID=1785087 RepID=UPI0013014997